MSKGKKRAVLSKGGFGECTLVLVFGERLFGGKLGTGEHLQKPP